MTRPLFVQLLGGFRVLKRGQPVAFRPGGKAEQLLATLALQARSGVPREELLALVWSASDLALASQSLNTLVYSVHRLLGDVLAGRPPVVAEGGRYRLNTDDGVSVDVLEFDAAAEAGDRAARAGDPSGAIGHYVGAVELYAGDLVVSSDVRQVLERERLRARYLSLLARIADHHFAAGEYELALAHALELLHHDPCREDAYRMAMRCYVRLGQRAQALRQYAVCRQVLAQEFDALPEGTTDALYELVRTDPAAI